MQRYRMRRKKSTRRQSRLISATIFVAAIVVCFFCISKISDYKAQSKDLAYQEKILEQKIDSAKVEQETMQAEKKYMKTNKYIEDVAKDKLGLVYPDEIVIRPQE